ncbi:MAG: hypothetical protein K0R60_1611 [Microbacterium sp.]|jgi:hypothetical protein|nr:hypothetical protein [Microbacterium sp.]
MSDTQNTESEHEDAPATDGDADAQQAEASEAGDDSLADADLEQPSTTYEPGEEPKSADGGSGEPSHEAVGIGIVDAPPLETGDDD